MANLTVHEVRETVRAQIFQAKGMIQPVLPKHVDFDQCLARMYKHMIEEPKIAQCTPSSLFWAFIQAAEVGLSVGGFFGEGFIIPYGSSRNPNAPKRARFIVGYKGLLKLSYQSPLVRRVDAYMVYSKDVFVPNLGKNEVYYQPYLGGDGPGDPIAAYTQIELASGAVKHHVMPMWALERIRASAPGRDNRDHPWVTHTNEMFRKTGLRAALKDAPRASEVDRAMETALRLDESTDSDAAYDDVPDLPGVSDDGPQGRAADTKAAVQAKAQPVVRSATVVERPDTPKAAPQAPKAAPVAPKPQAPKVAPVAPKPQAPKAASQEPKAAPKAAAEPQVTIPAGEPAKAAPKATAAAPDRPAPTARADGPRPTIVDDPGDAEEQDLFD